VFLWTNPWVSNLNSEVQCSSPWFNFKNPIELVCIELKLTYFSWHFKFQIIQDVASYNHGNLSFLLTSSTFHNCFLKYLLHFSSKDLKGKKDTSQTIKATFLLFSILYFSHLIFWVVHSVFFQKTHKGKKTSYQTIKVECYNGNILKLMEIQLIKSWISQNNNFQYWPNNLY